MVDDDTRMDLIRRYLLGQLSQKESIDFQTRLLLDPELRREVQMMRATQKVIFTQNGKGQKGGRWLLVLGVLAAVTAGIYLYRNGMNENMSNTPPPVQRSPENETVPAPSAPEKSLPPTDAAPPAKPAPKQYAAAFQPNAALEKHIGGAGNKLRSSSAGLVLDAPLAGARYSISGSIVEVPVGGSVKTGTVPLRALIFTNDPASYARYKPVWSADLSFENTTSDGRFPFRATANLPAKAGLYYLLLENGDTGAIQFVTSFQIIPAK